MATLETKDFDTLVEEQAAIVQGASTRVLVDFSVGSILRAVVEAYSAVGMWLQGLILTVLGLTRASTSAGSDLDSWMADYGVTRLPATAAHGTVTFSRQTATTAAVVPVGALVQTADGAQIYAVIADATNSNFDNTAGGYVIGIGNTTIDVPVQAQSAGAAGNALAGFVNTLGQAIVGIDAVTNAVAFAGGTDAESDPALRTRFVAYIASLSKATRAAVGYAISTVSAALTFSLVENETLDGTPQKGFFYVVIDDGTGSPPTNLIGDVYTAIDAVRPLDSTFAVYPPTIATATVSMLLEVSSNRPTAVAAAEAALAAFFQALPIGVGVKWSQLISVAYEASSLITNVTNVQLNGGTADIPGVDGTVIRAGTITVS